MIKTKRGRLYDPRVPIPPYLADADYAAPCRCGRPFDDEDPPILITGETGLSRCMHFGCLTPDMLSDDDD